MLDWILRRCDGEQIAEKTAIGYLPTENSLRLDGLTEEVDLKELFSTPSEFWNDEVKLVVCLDVFLRFGNVMPKLDAVQTFGI